MDRVVHFEIPVNSPMRATDFYSNVFGWKIKRFEGMNYEMVNTVEIDKKMMPKKAGAINGGIFKRKGNEKPIVVISVDNIERTLSRIKEKGLKTMHIQVIGNMGKYARFVDTEGNVVGLWENIKNG